MGVGHHRGLPPHPHVEQAEEKEGEEDGVVLLPQGWQSGVGGERGKRGKHPRCPFMEMHPNFCLTFLLFHFSKNVCTGSQSSFHSLLWFQSVYRTRSMSEKKFKSSLE